LITWPGFTGALSGVAPGRFAISLNAVLSDELPAFAPPITYVLRSVFEDARSFDEAVERLTTTDIASDCLLLVTGTRPGEMVVIERTPTRAAHRNPVEGRLLVANEYLSLSTSSSAAGPDQELQRTSCARFDRAIALLDQRIPRDEAECFAILTDLAVRMRITVQHMVFSAARGLVAVRLPKA
jgi:acid ceramidase